MFTQPSIALFDTIFLIGAAQTLFLTLALFLFRNGNTRANRYLAFFLLVFAYELFDEFMLNNRYWLYKPSVIPLTWIVDFLYGPLLYRYVQIMTDIRANDSSHIHLFHYLPASCFLLLLIPYWQLDSDSQIELFFMPVANPKGVSLYFTVLDDLQGILSIIQILVYLVLSFKLIQQYAVWVKENFSYLEKVNLAWLSAFLPALAVLWVMYVFSELVSSQFGIHATAQYLLHIGIVLAIYGLSIMALRQPKVFTLLREHEKQESSSKVKDISEKQAPPSGKYQKSALADTDIDRILSRLNQVMTSERPYLENNLALPSLARKVRVSPHYLSQAINEKLQMNFFDFINLARVEEAKKC